MYEELAEVVLRLYANALSSEPGIMLELNQNKGLVRHIPEAKQLSIEQAGSITRVVFLSVTMAGRPLRGIQSLYPFRIFAVKTLSMVRLDERKA